MTFIVADRVQETTNSPGTGTATLLGAVSGYQSFSTGIGANNTTFYVIADQLGTNWEVGLGALNATGTVLTRTTVYSSSNGGSTVNFATGTQYVWCDFPSSKAVIQGTAVNFSSIGATTAGTGAFTTLSASSTVSGTGFSNYFAAPPTIGNATPNAGTFTTLVATSITNSGLTAGRVNYNGVGGLLQDSANMTFDGSTLTTLNSAYTGTLTGGTGVVNLGSGQFYKDASGNVGIGTTTPNAQLAVRSAVTGSSATARFRGTDTTARLTRIQLEDYTGALADALIDFVIPTAGSASSALLKIGVNSPALTLNATGAVALAGGVTNATGVGITFPATQSASSDANTLDDYEEGTWTPAINRATTSPTSVTYAVQSGVYIKIGRQVWVSFDLTVTGAGTAGSGQNTITGFPFTSDVDVSNAGYPTLNYRACTALPVGPTATTRFAGYIAGTTYFCEFDNIGNAGSGTNSNVSGTWSNARMTGWMTYRTTN